MNGVHDKDRKIKTIPRLAIFARSIALAPNSWLSLYFASSIRFMFAGGIEASIIRLARAIPSNLNIDAKAIPRSGESNRRVSPIIPIAFIIDLSYEESVGSLIPRTIGIK